MWKFYENQLILNISSTSVVFTLFPSPVFFLLLPCSASFFPSSVLFTFSDARYRGDWRKLSGLMNSVSCVVGKLSVHVSRPSHVAAAGQSCGWNQVQMPGSNFGKSFVQRERSRAMSAWETWVTEEERVVQPHKIHPASSGPSLLLMPWLSIWWRGEWKSSF